MPAASRAFGIMPPQPSRAPGRGRPETAHGAPNPVASREAPAMTERKQDSPPGATRKRTRERLALALFAASVAVLSFAYGFAVGRYRIFPYRFLDLAAEGFEEVRRTVVRDELPWYLRRVDHPAQVAVRNTPGACQGVNVVTRVAGEKSLAVTVIDMEGRTLHEWKIDWFKIWPDAAHLPERLVPRSPPGTHIHGAVVMDDGGLVFNFEHLGLVRLSREGKVVWRLPYQTHHSVHRHDDGNLWVCGQKEHSEPSPRFPNRVPPFPEYTVLEVTPDGKIATEWSVAELLRGSGHHGLLYLGSLDNESVQIAGDALHLNDVEPFPEALAEGFFRHGDVLVSLRNINTVFAFNRRTGKIGFLCTGWFVRQHDPDFIDGNTFSVFDNNAIAPTDNGQQSRIVIVSAAERTCRTFFEGSAKVPFYTNIMGKHQWLPNGNCLITESRAGRAFELSPQGEVVWEYVNYVGDGVVGLVEEVQRLWPTQARLFTHRPPQSPPEAAAPTGG